MTEKEEKSSITTPKEEDLYFIPLMIFEKYIEITDKGIEFLNSFNNKVRILLKIIINIIDWNFRNNNRNRL